MIWCFFTRLFCQPQLLVFSLKTTGCFTVYIQEILILQPYHPQTWKDDLCSFWMLFLLHAVVECLFPIPCNPVLDSIETVDYTVISSTTYKHVIIIIHFQICTKSENVIGLDSHIKCESKQTAPPALTLARNPLRYIYNYLHIWTHS